MMNKIKRIPKFYIVLLLLLVIALLIQSKYLLDIIVMVFIWAGIANAWNISGGFAGQFSLGHAAFLGIGAYTSTLLYLNFSIPIVVGMLIGAVIASIFALITSVLFLRLRGPFYTLATIAFAELIFISVTQLRGVTQGAMGLSIPYEPNFLNLILTETKGYTILAFIFMLLVYMVSSYIKNSKTGYYLVAIKEDVDASQSLGINVTKLKTLAACISAFFTAIGGSLLTSYILFVEPENLLELPISIKIAMIAIVGGMNSPAGPILGAIILVPLEIFLRGFATDIAGLHLFCFGLILILVVLYKPKGIIDGMDVWFNNLFNKIKNRNNKDEHKSYLRDSIK